MMRSLLGARRALLIFIATLTATQVRADRSTELERIVSRANVEIAVAVRDEAGRIVFDHRGSVPMKPASVMKLLTAAATLHDLGPEYRFTTGLYGDLRDGTVPHLVVRGGGDPSLTIEQAWIMARKLRALSVRKIGRLSLDTGLFATPHRPPPGRAYEAGPSALPLNFNSLHVTICPGSPGKSAKVSVDPWEAGITLQNEVVTGGGKHPPELAWRAGRGGPMLQALGTIGSGAPCTVAYRSVEDPDSYFGSTFLALLETVGIDVPKNFEVARVLSGLPIIYTHESKPVTQILQDLNWYSNNFIAGQLLYALSKSSHEWRPELGLRALRMYLEALGAREGVVAVDGSGLSHENRMTADVLTRILTTAAGDRRGGIEFIHSLAVPGVAGTLEKRKFRGSGHVRAKTGSLDGVQSLAGFVWSRSGRRYAFAILQNGVGSRDRAREVEADIIALLGD